MRGLSLSAIMPTVGISGLIQSRILKPPVQTIFQAVDHLTPAFNAANAFQERYASIVDNAPFRQAMKAIKWPKCPPSMTHEQRIEAIREGAI